MSLARSLMEAGMPSLPAEYLGFSNLTPIDGSSSVPVLANNTLVTTSPGQTSITFSPITPHTVPYLTTSASVDGLLVRPNTGGTINGLTQVAASQNQARLNFRVGGDRWISFVTS